MKKCTSCTKDLPDAALHCVFCGAKQAAAPAVAAPNNAKTVMGYSANDMIEQLKASGQLPPSNAPMPPQNHPQAAPPQAYPMPMPAPAQTPAPMPMPPPMQQPQHSFSPAVPQAPSSAPTMFVNNPPPLMGGGGGGGYQPPAPAHAPGQQATMIAAQPLPQMQQQMPQPMPMQPGGGGFPSMQPPPMMQQPMQPVPMQQPMAYNNPYASMGPSAGMTPTDPFQTSLRLMMFIWGGLLLIAFVLPLRTSPMIFSWDAIIHAPGTAKIGPLLIGGGGLLSILFAMMPVATVGRAIVALVVGLAGVFVPMLLSHFPGVMPLIGLLGYMCIVIGLALRAAYHRSMLPRILTTVGVLAVLAPMLIPTDYGIPLVMMFKALAAGGGGQMMLFAILTIVHFLLVLAALLVWIPDGSGGATAILWCILGFPVLTFVLALVMSGHVGMLGDSPAMALSWAAGGGMGEEGGRAAAVGIPVAFAALIAYGGAATFGKALE